VLGLEPQTLVRGAIYRFVRNPMYVGVTAILWGEALVFASPNLLVYAATAWLVFHLVIVFLEEPHLRRTRGPEYVEYCRTTPRWIPRIVGKRKSS
jgi:protein-S-isoprenylcysteine O-methyltransferase Ste14